MILRPIFVRLFLVSVAPALWSQAAGSVTPGAPPTVIAENANAADTYTVPASTKILLSLKHEITTRTAQPGDTVYFESVFPVVSKGVVVIPAGMYVKGTIDKVQRPGRVKGRAELQLHFATIIFPNGVELEVPGTPDQVAGSTGANVKNAEGTIEQSASKGKDAQRIANTTLQGSGAGALVGWGAGNPATGAGVGAGAGAAAGVITTLFTRGNDIVFPQGTTLEMMLSRPLYVKKAMLQGMPTYTGVGPATK